MKILAATLVLLTTLPACIIVVSDDGVEIDHASRGSRASETRTVEPFHALTVATYADVGVRAGETQSVTVTGPADLLPFVRTLVHDGVLTIELGPGAPPRSGRLNVQLSVPALDAATLTGSGEVALANLAGPKLRLELSGSGGLRAGGSVEELDVVLNGSGDVHAYGLGTRAARVRLCGSGDVELSARETLDAELDGTGDVRYRGSPRVTHTVRGSGSVERH